MASSSAVVVLAAAAEAAADERHEDGEQDPDEDGEHEAGDRLRQLRETADESRNETLALAGLHVREAARLGYENKTRRPYILSARGRLFINLQTVAYVG